MSAPTLATHALGDPDQIALFADGWTATHKPFADAFRDACEAEAAAHGGWVNPNAVRARLLDHDGYEPRQYAGLWSVACGREGYLDKTDMPVRISGEGSKGNGNKSTFWRRWRGEVS